MHNDQDAHTNTHKHSQTPTNTHKPSWTHQMLQCRDNPCSRATCNPPTTTEAEPRRARQWPGLGYLRRGGEGEGHLRGSGGGLGVGASLPPHGEGAAEKPGCHGVLRLRVWWNTSGGQTHSSPWQCARPDKDVAARPWGLAVEQSMMGNVVLTTRQGGKGLTIIYVFYHLCSKHMLMFIIIMMIIIIIIIVIVIITVINNNNIIWILFILILRLTKQ